MKKDIIKIIISVILFIVGLVVPYENEVFKKAIFVISYIIVGYEIVEKAIKNIIKGEILDENFLMTIAGIGAFAIGEFPEAVAIVLFYQIGEVFQDYAVDKSRKSISSLMDLRPDYANLKNGEDIQKVEPQKIKIGDKIIIKPGEKVPLDGIVIDGESRVNLSALTGESITKKAEPGYQILSGAINQEGLLTVRVTKRFEESTVSKILELVENANEKKSKSENFVTKFAKFYTPIVVVTALILAFIPPIILKESISIWVARALSFLVVSCPCALVISIPLGFFGGIGGASKKGILIKGSNYLENLRNAKIVVFDKTGTLTKGTFEIQKIEPIDIEKEELNRIVAHAENFSTHPIAVAIKNSYNGKIDPKIIWSKKELSGKGIIAKVEGKEVLVGNIKLMEEKNIDFKKCEEIGTIVYVAINGKYAGYIQISDTVKDDAKLTIMQLKENGVKKTVMLTGDEKNVGEEVSKEIGIDQVFTELLPNQKVEMVQELLEQKDKNEELVFVGDGINDAPVLALSDIGIAMGGLGSDAAIEAADIVIMTDEPSKIIEGINISKKTMKIVKQNIILAIGIKILVLIFSAFGISNLWEAVFADVGVTIIAIINSLRMLI